MQAVALDLRPIVDALLEQPYDRLTLDDAFAAVGRNPQAYATALRCAAKRAPDGAAAAFWFLEAARVHESVDDIGGCIALLTRAWSMDPTSHTRELLAASMARLAARVGLGFSFATPQLDTDRASEERTAGSSRPPPLESGMRPAAPDRPRDTLPDLFGLDAPETARVIVAAPAEATSEPSSSIRPDDGRVKPMLPPRDPGVSASVTPPRSEDEPLLRAVANLTIPSPRPTMPAPISSAPPPSAPLTEAVPGLPPAEDLYAEGGPPTERPIGDGLVGALFEALHGLHFVDDVREGAAFLRRVLEEKTCASAVLVHLYDINSAHFVIVSAHGTRASALLDYATPEDDSFVTDVMRGEETTLVQAPAADPRLARGRWLLVEPQRSVLCAPVCVEGRSLALLELADPTDGSTFTENDGKALAYAASTFARFLSRRGIVLSEEPGPGADRASIELLPA